jgi:hypothetical protein
VTQLTGQPVEFVQQKLGLPHQRKDLPTGAMVWTYIDNDKGIMGTQCSVIVSIRKNQVERVSVITNTTSAVSMLGKPCATLRAKIG